MLAAFDRVSRHGTPEVVLVTGYSGTGKSSLVYEVHKPITGKNGLFISGKFDQFHHNEPYYALRQAFDEFVTLILTEPEASLHQWQQRIMAAIGNLGQVLLDLSKIEAQKMELTPHNFPLHLFLKDLIETIRIRARQKGITLNTEIPADLPVGVYADERRLRQVLVNLLNNAIKFTEKGKVTLRVARLMIDDCRLSIEKHQQTISNQQSSIFNFQLRILASAFRRNIFNISFHPSIKWIIIPGRKTAD